MTKNNWDKYQYTQWIEEYFKCKNMSDVQFTEPWITFEDYILNGMDAFKWSFEDLLKVKKTMKFRNGILKEE